MPARLSCFEIFLDYIRMENSEGFELKLGGGIKTECGGGGKGVRPLIPDI